MGASGKRGLAKKALGKLANTSSDRTDSEGRQNKGSHSSSGDDESLEIDELEDVLEVLRITSNFEAPKVFALEDTLAEDQLVCIWYFLLDV